MRIIVVSPPKTRKLGRFVLPYLKHCILDLAIARKFLSVRIYAEALRALSEALPYDVVRKFDEKLGISLAWEFHRETDFAKRGALKSALFSKLLEFKPEDLTKILDELASYFNVELKTTLLELTLKNYLSDVASEDEFIRVLDYVLGGWW